MIDNGYAPEWVMLGREIREDKERIKQILYKERKRLGPLPLSEVEEVCVYFFNLHLLFYYVTIKYNSFLTI